ncbi:MAG: DegT/DnrJ/EryC1/StrS family aminotransferase [Phycisphaerales bacterium]|nr:DegT/DnrJ/EryC1/StrS family aminotransferase [Phycisphaerales bacterium]
MIEEIPLSRPEINEDDQRAVMQVLRSGRLSIGPMIEQFESEFAELVGRRHAIGCSSGTAGLHMALLAHGIGPGDEVITTPFSFIASSNCIVYVGATPVFVDIEPKSLNMDPGLIEAAITPRTKAILAVEVFGSPAHMATYRAIADKHDLKLIEDSCEGLGGRWRDRAIGSFGHSAVFGFYPNKQITTGEGGMVVTNDDRVADVCRALRNQGRAPSGTAGNAGNWLHHELIGFNYRMSEINAALGLSQIRRLDTIIERRQQVASRYIERLMGNPELLVPTVDPETLMSWFVFVVRLRSGYSSVERDRILDGMRRHDVGCSAYFPCIHLQPCYRERFGTHEGSFPIAESASQRTIALPFYTDMSPRDTDFAAQTLELMITRETFSRE